MICVLSGGPSGECHASRASASAVHSALVAEGMDAAWIDLAANGRWSVHTAPPAALASLGAWSEAQPSSWQDGLVSLLSQCSIELIFPAIHGAVGEDGQVQALCESLGLPYVGSDPQASLSCYDKVLFKRTVAAAGVPTAADVCVERTDYRRAPRSFATIVGERLGYPCIVKPARSGSSLGLARVDAPEALADALAQAFPFGDLVLVEPLVAGSDVEVGVLGTESPTIGSPVEIRCDAPLYDFAAKYETGDSLQVPADLHRQVRADLIDATRTAFDTAGCRGMARVDFLVDRGTGRFVVNELNTIPYMTRASSFAESLRDATGQPFERLMADLVRLSRHATSGSR